jgi:hypothetical protein
MHIPPPPTHPRPLPGVGKVVDVGSLANVERDSVNACVIAAHVCPSPPKCPSVSIDLTGVKKYIL